MEKWKKKNGRLKFFFVESVLHWYYLQNTFSLCQLCDGGKLIKSKTFVFKCWQILSTFSNKWTNLKQKKKEKNEMGTVCVLSKTIKDGSIMFLSNLIWNGTILTWLFGQTLIAHSSLLRTLPKKILKKLAFDEKLWY